MKFFKPTSPVAWVKVTTVCVTILIAMLVVGVAYAATFVIDPFSAGEQFVFAGAGDTSEGFATDATIPSSILGSERDVQVTAFTSLLYVSIDPDVDDRLDFAAGPGGFGTSLIQWDGIDTSMDLDVAGLCTTPVTDCADFTDERSNDSFVMRIISNDNPTEIQFRVYTSLTDWSDYSFTTPGSIDLGDVVDIVIPFDSFTDHGSGADWENIGAFEIFINAISSQAVDLSIDFFHTDSVRDFGDLPETGTPSYPGLTLLTNGARHVPQGLRLGPSVDAQVDTEADGQPDVRAGTDQILSPGGGDDGNPIGGPNDEDGVNRNMDQRWIPGANVDLIVEVYGCPDPGPCYLNGWIDWNRNGSFADSDDQIFTNEEVVKGVNTLPIPIPGDYILGDAVFSRFRLCAESGAPPDGCDSLTGETFNGEVEDYWWDFDDPTAITLTNIEAKNNTPLLIAAAAGLLVLVSGGAVLAYKRSRA